MLEVLRVMLELGLREVERGGVKGSLEGWLETRKCGVTGALWHGLCSGEERMLVLLALLGVFSEKQSFLNEFSLPLLF